LENLGIVKFQLSSLFIEHFRVEISDNDESKMSRYSGVNESSEFLMRRFDRIWEFGSTIISGIRLSARSRDISLKKGIPFIWLSRRALYHYRNRINPTRRRYAYRFIYVL